MQTIERLIKFKLIMIKKLLLYLEKKTMIFFTIYCVFWLLYTFVVESITYENKVLSLHLFSHTGEQMIKRGIGLFAILIFTFGSFEIKEGTIKMRPEKRYRT